MKLSESRIIANKVVAHVHYASNTTQFNVSFDKDAGQHVLFCMNDDKKSTAEFFVGAHQTTVYLIIKDLAKLGYAQF
ncbi:MAG: hypothetical protein GY830_10675 [Bacteroidetes bacterium]|jgi:hypothetical protein|nr:hypothetical protein [Bacteroidota bacterium]